jgi:hypothetical protein
VARNRRTNVLDARICAPASLQPSTAIRNLARGLAAGSGARLMATDDLAAEVRGADFLYTDVWLSMGEPAGEWDQRIECRPDGAPNRPDGYSRLRHHPACWTSIPWPPDVPVRS